MSSVPALEALLQDNYVSLAIFTAGIYDYVLVFPNEVEYIWCKPWTKVSTLFILVRYCGLFNLVMDALCEILNVFGIWIGPLFLGAADFVMVLRIWAMYNRSRLILGILLTFYSVEIISLVMFAAAYSDPKNYRYIVIQTFEYSFCGLQDDSPIWIEVTCIVQMIFAAVLCMFAITHFVRESISLYGVTKHAPSVGYINLLIKQGILYFIVVILLNIVAVLTNTGNFPVNGWQAILGYIIQQVPVYTLTPRFIISVREMHAHDVQARRGTRIDTGFGLSTSCDYGNTVKESTVFVTGEQSRVADDVEAAEEQSECMDMVEMGENDGKGAVKEVARESTSAY